uniref:Uncharacterized protein n=1 Tax=Caenorhabditis japonica TaxID=281687 RepID=A0A8R1EPH8_CAEJA
MLADLQARHGQLADLIVGQDILPSLYRDTKTFLLPSGRRIEKTPLGVITHPIPSQKGYQHPDRWVDVRSGATAIDAVIHLIESVDENSITRELDNTYHRFHSLEVLGITPPSSIRENNLRKEEFMKAVKEKTTYENGRLAVPLLFNGREKELGDNRRLAMSRLGSSLTKLSKNGLLNVCHDLIQD